MTTTLPSRAELWKKLSETEFDLCVIGGGITGAGIARDATLRGLKVALVEKKDFGWGTSSRSSKLAHGGFRYLEHYKFGLVMESLRERKVLMNIAPHMVHPLPFYIPVYKGEKPPAILLRLGLIAYEYLSLGKRIGSRKWHSAKKAVKLFPSIRKEKLKGIGQYYDCQMNDARLCLENILTAIEGGATVVNYTEVTGFTKNSSGKVTDAQVKDVETNTTTSIKAKIFVNATGPWSDLVKQYDNPDAKKRLANAKGVHIITKRVIKDNKALAIALKDGRIIFVLPYHDRHTLIGTTDTFYDGSLEDVICLEDEVEYLLEGYNKFFPGNPLTKDDVISSYAGLRPLVYDEKHGADSKDVSREHKIFIDESGLISIIGGKYTTFRRMGKTITDIVIKQLKEGKQLSTQVSKCTTDKVPLRGGSFPSFKKWEKHYDKQVETLKSNYKLDISVIKSLLNNYGVQTEHILSMTHSEKNLSTCIVNDAPHILAEVVYCIQHEYCRSIEDFYWLRTFLALETDFSSSLDKVGQIFKEKLHWTDERLESEKEKVRKRLEIAQFK